MSQSQSQHRKLDPIVRRLLEAEGYLELGLPELALEALDSRADWASVQFEASYLKGEALRLLDRHREAIKALEVAASLRPGNIHVAMALGWCYKRTHRLAQAIDALEGARRAHPDHPLLHYNLACYWSLANNPARALESLASALEIQPDLRSMISVESDFDSIRNLPEFGRLIAGQTPRR